ncbi:MAG TPA: hypothetical protein VFM55_17755 [Micromonosporaceae bacterium]|nr:hypothetical protein [Micromonosporaceae bacterium]
MTPSPTTRIRYTPAVSHHTFVLADPYSAETPLTGEPPDDLVAAAPGGALFATAGNDFTPTVDVELWGAEPPAAGDEWEDVDEATIDNGSGTARIQNVHGEPAGPDLTLAPGRYHVRAYARGRSEAAARLGIELFYTGVEEWLVRLWPAS